jgi:hypothetical protein
MFEDPDEAGKQTKDVFSIILSLRLDVFVLFRDEWWWLGNILPENVSLDEIRKPCLQLIGNKCFGWNRENLCERR